MTMIVMMINDDDDDADDFEGDNARDDSNFYEIRHDDYL